MTAAERHTSGFRLDGSYRRPGSGDVVIGGSPLRLFRLTAAGKHVADALERDATLPPGHARLTDRLLDAGAIHPVPLDIGVTPAEVTVVTPALDALPDLDPHADPHADPQADPTLDTIIVDDGSDVPLVVDTGQAHVRLIRLVRNSGPAAARNAGLAEVSTAFVAFVDTDVELSDGWLAPLLAHFADPKVALVAPRVRTSPGGSAMVDNYEALRGSLDLGPVEARIAPGSRVAYVPAAAIVCRVAALRSVASEPVAAGAAGAAHGVGVPDVAGRASIGGFDEELRFGEDVDLVWRLHEAGWRCRYEPSSEVTHRARPTLTGWARQRFAYGTSAAPLAARHPGALAPLRVSGWSAAVWALVALRRPAAAAVVTAATAVALQRKLRGVPPEESARLAIVGHLYAGEQIARAITRAWTPIALAAAVVTRRVRLPLAAAVFVPPVLAWIRVRERRTGRTSPRGLATFVAMHVADDVIYGEGVWAGAWQARDPAALLPELRNWPPRRGLGQRADR